MNRKKALETSKGDSAGKSEFKELPYGSGIAKNLLRQTRVQYWHGRS
jgi:hypothetical protein